MADIVFYMYPRAVESEGGTRGRQGSPADCDDAWDLSDGVATVYRQYGGSTSAQTGWTSFQLTPPQTAVTIAKIRVHYKLYRSSGGGSWPVDQEFVGAIRPAASGNYYSSATRVIVDSGGTAALSGSYAIATIPWYNSNQNVWTTGTGPAHAYWEWTQNPVSVATWTVADLQQLLACFAFDPAKGTPGPLVNVQYSDGGGPSVALTSMYVEVFASQLAANVEDKRKNATAFLRLFRNPMDVVHAELPLSAAGIDIGETVALTHELGPTSSGLGWGPENWKRRYGMLVSKSFNPLRNAVQATILDLSRFHCNVWFPAISDRPYTEEGQGVPYLDMGGGRTCYRISYNDTPDTATKAYVKRATNDTLYAEVPLNYERWTPDGLGVFRESYMALTYNSFQTYSGGFTGWTTSTAGTGALSQTTSDFLFDVTGLRSAAVLNAGGTTGAGNYAGVYQATASLGATGNLRVHIIAKRTGGTGDATNFFYRLVASDGYYWRDSDSTWQAGSTANQLSATTGSIVETQSKMISSRGTGTYTLYVYIWNNGGANNAGVVYYAGLWWGSSATGGTGSTSGIDMQRGPFVTGSVPDWEGQDMVSTASPPAMRSWPLYQGTAIITAKTAWAHADMEIGAKTGQNPSKIRILFLNFTDNDNYDLLAYVKQGTTYGEWFFKRRLSAVDYMGPYVYVAGANVPAVGDVYKIGLSWQASGGELGNANNTVRLYVSRNGGTPETDANTAVAVTAWPNPSNSNCTLYYGSGFSSQFDGYLRSIEVVPYVLDQTEIYRRIRV